MANYKLLKDAIKAVVKANGNEEITGDALQQTLLAIVDALGEGYQFMGLATPTTDPGVLDKKVCYLAKQNGVYSHFGGLKVKSSEKVDIFIFDTAWSKIVVSTVDADIVRYTLQNTSDEQKEQARKNIGALSDANGAVNTANVKDEAITTEKIANGSITTNKIAPKQITEFRLADTVAAKINDNVKYIEQDLTTAQQKQARENIGISEYVTFDDVSQLEENLGERLLYVGKKNIGNNSIPAINANILEIDFNGASINTIGDTIRGHAHCKLKNLVVDFSAGSEDTELFCVQGFGYVENVYLKNSETDFADNHTTGFMNCDHLYNCVVEGGGKAHGENGFTIGFKYCNYLVQCRYKGNDYLAALIAYSHCNFISQCYMSYGREDGVKYSLGTNKNVESLIGILADGSFETFADTDHLTVGDYNLDNFIKLISSDGGTGKSKLYAKPDDKSGMATVLMDTNAVNWAVARRTASGTLKAKDATENDDVVTLKQLNISKSAPLINSDSCINLEGVVFKSVDEATYMANISISDEGIKEKLLAYNCIITVSGELEGSDFKLSFLPTSVSPYYTIAPFFSSVWSVMSAYAIYDESSASVIIVVQQGGIEEDVIKDSRNPVTSGGVYNALQEQKNAVSSALREVSFTDNKEHNKVIIQQMFDDWKALTGDTQGLGMRFVGYVTTEDGGADVLLTYNKDADFFIGYSCDDVGIHYKVRVTNDGTLNLTKLYSRFEALSLFEDNSEEHKAANLAAIQAYEQNLIALGIDIEKFPIIPANINDLYTGTLQKNSGGSHYSGFFASDDELPYFIIIHNDGEVFVNELKYSGV